MNSPDYLEKAGEIVASVYSQIESDMLNQLVLAMYKGDITNQRSITALAALAQSAGRQLENIMNRYSAQIDQAVKNEVREAIRESDKDDLERIKRGLGVELPEIDNRTIAATVAGVEAILARDNLAMIDGAKNAFIEQSSWAITQVNTGNMTTEKALHKAVRELTKQGITVITYQNPNTGRVTVRNKVDVAIRRHIRTQILQEGMRLTETRLDQAGVELVEVSSHTGARPSHAKWQGRIYSRNGDRTIDGVHYRDFRSACNWGDVADGIGGANCRHSYAAWFPGMARTYEPEPEHPSGESNEKIYKLTQKQRALEREIRETKRELAASQLLADNYKRPEDESDVIKLQLRLKKKQAAMRKLISDNDKILQRSPRREWAGDMPKRKVNVKQKPPADPMASYNRIKGDHTREDDAKATNPKYTEYTREWTQNCQRCVSAYEARRRGYDVTAKPRGGKEDSLPYMNDRNGWPNVYKDPELIPCTSNTGENTRKKVEAQMKGFGDGARAIVRVTWRNQRSGHVFIAEQVNGKTRFIDPQTGDPDCSRYFRSAKKNGTYLLRVDNRDFTDLILQCCEEV